MAPIIGIMASANWASANASSFDSIATATAAGGETSFTFSSIPSTYKHLQIRILYKDTYSTTANTQVTQLQFNGDTGTNYVYHYLQGNGTSATAGGATGQTAAFVVNSGGTSAAGQTSIFGVGIADILDYASTSKNKTIRSIGGLNNNTTSTSIYLGLSSSLWLNTAAITSIKILPGNIAFAAGTTFALYGIK